MNKPVQLLLAPPATAIQEFLGQHRTWIEVAIGCPLADAVTFEFHLPFEHLALDAMFGGIPIDRQCLPYAKVLQPVVTKWELPPDSIHAKFYAFEQGNQVTVFVGSANCSRAALLIPGKQGNAELVAVQLLGSDEFRECFLAELRLLDGVPVLPNVDPPEVVLPTYLGTVDLLGKAIEETYPGQGVVVLRGGDHGAKLAAERRFKSKDGPRVLVCTAAGREGINLQFARILFNFDLPWNPMDLEQRIGRIHRYGQMHTAQVYNLVLSDTIEGRIFLLLNDKLHEIARALGKVDEQGNVAEDLRSQILGQLSERLNYDRLYQEALSDPELKRTRLELEAAVGNAEEARRVVFDLFQDLDDFRLDDYKPFSDVESSLARLICFLTAATEESGHRVRAIEKNVYEIEFADGRKLKITTNRELGKDRQDLELIGLDHPLAQELLGHYKRVPAEAIGVAVQADDTAAGVVSLWFVETHGKAGERKGHVQAMAVDLDGQRLPQMERAVEKVFHQAPAEPSLTLDERRAILKKDLEPMLSRDLQHRGVVADGMGFSLELIGWIEIG